MTRLLFAFTLTLATLSAQAYNISLGYFPVAKVAAEYEGSGLVFTCKGKLFVLTNSHLLIHQQSANITFPSDETVQGKLIQADPFEDWAILSIKSKLKVVPSSVELCETTQHEEEDVENIEWNAKFIFKLYTFSGIVSTTGQHSMLVDDEYIAAVDTKIFYVPTFARPGYSGSPLFSGGIWLGLITKIDSSGSPGLYAIPSFYLALRVREALNKNPAINGRKLTISKSRKPFPLQPRKRSRYLRQDHQIYLQVWDKNLWWTQKIFSGPQTPSGGGDPGNGGGEKSIPGLKSNWLEVIVPKLGGGFPLYFRKANPLQTSEAILLSCPGSQTESDTDLTSCQKIRAMTDGKILKAPTIARVLKLRNQTLLPERPPIRNIPPNFLVEVLRYESNGKNWHQVGLFQNDKKATTLDDVFSLIKERTGIQDFTEQKQIADESNLDSIFKLVLVAPDGLLFEVTFSGKMAAP